MADSSSPLFSLLLSHRDIICSTPSPDPGGRGRGRRKKDTQALSPSSPSACCPQLNFLKSADLQGSQRKVTSLKPETVGLRRKEDREGSSDVRVSREGGAVTREQHGSVNNVVVREMSLSARQRVLSQLSELEEDEEEDDRLVKRPHPPPLPHPAGNSVAPNFLLYPLLFNCVSCGVVHVERWS